MTIMNRLFQKGFLARTLKLRTHFYEPAVPYTTVRDAALNSLVDSYFGGERENLREFLLDDSVEPVHHSLGAARGSMPGRESSLDETLL
jgi:predicted transcriptional regulator